jgi:RNA polymerase subunit RPABC4/transcription elongation factor Spt4
MALYCTTCRVVVTEGEATCGNCRNGFTSKLACGACNRVVPTGTSYCQNCSVISARVSRSPILPPLTLGSLPALPPGMTLERAVVPESYSAGRFGADAYVQMNGRDAEILTKMNQVAMLLHALAADMNDFQGVAESTRRLIKGCRNMATEILEEVEVRRGPER